jgi:hypothetical protein
LNRYTSDDASAGQFPLRLAILLAMKNSGWLMVVPMVPSGAKKG